MQQDVLILGNSHVQAIKKNSPLPTGVRAYWIKSKTADVPGDIDLSQACDLAAGLAPDAWLVVMWLGTQHNLTGLLNHEQPFALLDGWDSDRPADLIPEAVMHSAFRAAVDTDRVLPRLRRIANCRIGHVMPPPPKEDLSALMGSDLIYRGKRIADVGFAPARHRLALWKLEQRVLVEHLSELGITPIAPPPETVTDQGFLDRYYAARDATHGNAFYGARLIDHVRTAMQIAEPPQDT